MFLKKIKIKKAKGAIETLQHEGMSFADRGFLQGISERDGTILIHLELDSHALKQAEPIKAKAQNEAEKIFKNKDIKVFITQKNEPKPRAHVKAPTPNKGDTKTPPSQDLLPGVQHIIAVASGKGGVGKSTLSFNLAVEAAKQGLKVGLLDADIYGPSVPKLSGLEGQKPQQTEDGKIIPFEKFKLKIMSIGFMVEAESPMIWRGPMVQSALLQMMRDVDWGELDILFIDMPPGTGDAQLTLAQKVPLSGAVLISTPQDIALIDARKGLKMFEKTAVPILGIVENMSYYHCPNCSHQDPVFGHGGAEADAKKYGVPFLGSIPLNSHIREACDKGLPLSQLEKDESVFDFGSVFKNMQSQLSNAAKKPPVIEIID